MDDWFVCWISVWFDWGFCVLFDLLVLIVSFIKKIFSFCDKSLCLYVNWIHFCLFELGFGFYCFVNKFIIIIKLNELHRLEESYWHARAKANELRDGDKNTKYFHHKANKGKKRNTITGLYDEVENWKTFKKETDAIIGSYFEHLFATENPNQFEEAIIGIEKVISEDMSDQLEVEATREEIREALFQMHPDRAPGPDEMHTLFFQNFGMYWDLMWFILLRDGGGVKLIWLKRTVLVQFWSLSTRIQKEWSSFV